MTTLVDYYKSKGQALPSIQERANIASQAGISNYSGSASQNQALLSYLQKQGASSSSGSTYIPPKEIAPGVWTTGGYTLPTTSAPGSADGITSGINTTNLPTKSPYFGNISDANAATEGMKTQLDILQKQEQDRIAEAKAQRDQLLAEQSKNQSLLASLLGSQKSQAQQRSDSFASLGIDPAKYFADEKAKIAEIGKLTEEYSKTKAAMDGEILQKRDMLGLNSAISKEQAAIERKYSPRLNILSAEVNSKSATLQALQGQFNEAQKFVNQAIEDSTADLKFKLDSFKLFYDMNQDSISRLDSQYKDALNNSINAAEKKYNEEVARKKAVGDAMIKYNALGANISINDSEDVVARKIASVGGDLAYYKKQQQIQKQYSGTGVVGTDDTDLETWAQSYADGEVTITNIPQKMRAKVIARANQIAEEALSATTQQTTTSPSSSFDNLNIPNIKSRLNKAFRTTAVPAGNPLIRSTASFFSNLFGG